MKSLTTVLALGMFAAVQLVGSTPGQAQNAVPNSLGLQTTSTNLIIGQTFDVNGLMTSGQNAGGKAGNIVNVSAVLVYDPSVFQPLGFTAAKDNSGGVVWDLLNPAAVKGTFTVTGNPDKDGTYSYIAYNGGRTTAGKPDLTGTDLQYGTFQFQVLPDAKTGDTQIYYSSWNFKSKDLNNDGRLKSFLGTNPQLPTTFEGSLGITVRTPGPSSLLVFAMGAFPALSTLRHRRRARAAARS